METMKEPQVKQNNEESDVIIIRKDILKSILVCFITIGIMIGIFFLCLYIGKRYDKNDNGGQVPFWTAVTKDPPEISFNKDEWINPAKIVVNIDKKDVEYKYVIIAIILYEKEPEFAFHGPFNIHYIATRNNQVEYYLNPEEILNVNYVKCEVYSYY